MEARDDFGDLVIPFRLAGADIDPKVGVGTGISTSEIEGRSYR